MQTYIQLMFTGQAEEAMNHYVSLFPDGKVESIRRYGPETPGQEGKVVRALFTIAGQKIACHDSPPVHDFTFTPSISLFVDCETEDDVRRLVGALEDKAMMPLGDWGFSRLFAFIQDRFGVSWQIKLVEAG